MTLGLNNDVSFFTKAKSFFKGSSKKLEQQIKPDRQFTFKDEEGNLHDIMLIKLNEDVSAKLPTINLPSLECTRPEQGQKIEIGGMGPKKAGMTVINNHEVEVQFFGNKSHISDLSIPRGSA